MDDGEVRDALATVLEQIPAVPDGAASLRRLCRVHGLQPGSAEPLGALLDGLGLLHHVRGGAEATTAPDTKKHAMSKGYAAREQWLGEGATPAADVYAFGVMAYELFAGRPPFTGDEEDLREHHVHTSAPRLTGVAAPLAALVQRCMDKTPETRPTPAAILDQLALAPASSPGLRSLASADADLVDTLHHESARKSMAASEAGRRARPVR